MEKKLHSCGRKLHSAVSPSLLALALVLAMVPAWLLAGCGQAASGGGPSADNLRVAMSALVRLAPVAPEADVASAAASIEAFAADLYGLLATDAGDGNVVFSPSSIVTALAMTYAGARGTTAEQMAGTLHFALRGDALHQALNSLDRTLESRNFSEKDYLGTQRGVLVKTADSLWGQKSIVFEQPFLDTLATNYGAGIRLVDFWQATEKARSAINDWVAGETEGRIPELVPESAAKDLASAYLVLVDATYLDATWMREFSPTNTTDGEFTTLSGTTARTPMMHQTTTYRYGTGDGWQTVELPYAGGKLAMLLVVPDKDRFAEVEAELVSTDGNTGLLAQSLASLGDSQKVALALPKFTFRTHASLVSALKALGMTAAFDPGSADLSGMTTQVDTWLGDVVHEAYIAVDEEGTEAAAATGVTTVAGISLDPPIELTLDRPFLFAIRDLVTGELLFLGRVTDPTAI
jgi:serpin B